MTKISNLYALTNYISANSSGNVVIEAPTSGTALYVTGSAQVTGQLNLGSTITNGTFTYTLPSATGTLALTSALSGYLPLTGGTMTGGIIGTTVSLTTSTLVDGLLVNNGLGRGIRVVNSGAGFGVIINNETASSAIPLTIQKQGASVISFTDAGAGSFASSLTASSFIRTSGTSSQFLKADGSVDSTAYVKGSGTSTYLASWSATANTLTNSLVSTFGNITTVEGMGLSTLNGLDVQGNYGGVANAPKIRSYDATTSSSYIDFLSTGGRMYFGLNRSTANGMMTGATAYATVLTTGLGTTNLEFGTNLTKRMTIDGSTGEVTLTGALSGTTLALTGGTGGINFTSSTTITNTASSGFTAIYANGGGIYLGGSASTNHLSILSSGSVGINTTSPTQRLEVVSNNVRVAATDTTNGTAGFYMRVQNGGTTVSNATIRTDNAGLFSIFTGTTGENQSLNITPSGNVGIGTTAPNGKLDIVNAGDAYVNILSTNPSTSTVLSMFNSSGTTDGAAIGYNTAMRFGTVTGANAAGFTERMRITAGGNVGIGTTAPGDKLHVDGGVILSGNITNYGTGSGVYTRSVWYVNSAEQILFENGRTSDSSTGTGRTVYFTWRGGPAVGGGVQLIHGTNTWAPYTSDARLKTIIANIENGVDAIMKLNPVKYKWSKELEKSVTVLGFTAQNVGEAIPEAMFKSWKDNELGDVLSYRPEYLTPYIVKALQEQQFQIQELKEQLANK